MTQQAPPTNRSDPERRRATYKLAYPQEELVFDTSASFLSLPRAHPQDPKSTVEAKRLSFKAERKNVDNVVFRECNFHDKKGLEQARISRITFRECFFKRSIMGTCTYTKVRFIRCNFETCDFSDAEFVQCVFDDCQFISCTGDRINFDRTEINPAAFLGGYTFPIDNYAGAAPEQKLKHEREWQEARYRTAGQLFRSNNESFDSGFADAALRELKEARLQYKWYKFKNEHSSIGQFAQLALEKANLILTQGGTSISRLLLFALAFVFIIPFWLDAVGVDLHSQHFQIRASDLKTSIANYLLAVPNSGGLFLGFGHGFFSSQNVLGAWSLLAISFLGLIWYALAIPVLIRKVYR
ncbi:hypothetical protein HMI49_40285 [Corallococcus exercitus]|uniref:Pentapeptide repeat-containing protein n=1 Tax=Corallococcus exercitus TaxID=2316736 RepID=A0A7Y4NWW5_9BACT|nr:pentapeptide repeat-containing protein [Corallococcus exercitus]NOK39426.1 hypothetical protein [Corallococcus exercitus]